MTSMARITSPGWSPGAIKIGSSPGISSQPSRNLITAAAGDGDQRHEEFGEDLEAVDHFSGINFNPSATSTATMITGIIFIRISAKVNSTGWPLISPGIHRHQTAGDTADGNGDNARQHAERQPAAIGRFDNAERHRNGEHTWSAPSEPRIRPEYIRRHVAAREFFSEEETAHVARQQRAGEHRRVGAEHLIQRNNHRTKQMSQHWRRGSSRPSPAQRAHRHKPFFKLTAGSSMLFPSLPRKRAEPPNCDRIRPRRQSA